MKRLRVMRTSRQGVPCSLSKLPTSLKAPIPVTRIAVLEQNRRTTGSNPTLKEFGGEFLLLSPPWCYGWALAPDSPWRLLLSEGPSPLDSFRVRTKPFPY
jgi:hypothetical protein